MHYLLDTNIFTKMAIERDLLSENVRDIIDNYENIIYISSESVKEFIHLIQNEKIVLKKNIRSLDVFEFVENTLGFNVKYVAKKHLRTLAKLESVENHNDPSDRP